MIACAAYVLSALLCSSQAARQDYSVALAISVDRKIYLREEMLFVDWAVTNQGNLSVSMPSFPEPLDAPPFALVVTKPDGKTITMTTSSSHCGKRERFWAATGTATRGWFFWGGAISGLDMSGKYSVQAQWEAELLGLKDNSLAKVKIVSNRVSFEVVEPERAHKKAASLILNELSPVPKDTFFFGFREAVIYSDPGFCKKIVDTGSARFAAIAHFFNGQRLLESALRRKDSSTLKSAMDAFLRCKSSEGSRYLKGLAELEYRRCRIFEEAFELDRLAREYPNSAVESFTKKVLRSKLNKDLRD